MIDGSQETIAGSSSARSVAWQLHMNFFTVWRILQRVFSSTTHTKSAAYMNSYKIIVINDRHLLSRFWMMHYLHIGSGTKAVAPSFYSCESSVTVYSCMAISFLRVPFVSRLFKTQSLDCGSYKRMCLKEQRIKAVRNVLCDIVHTP
ncbi:hypothetical protein TNCV_210861 [Trichonephila clavipes]|uniref:Uncharacterized protein n=1 Tax=Trichonephila clavipes TaxID=2585209 RepID=A0A8X6VS96_TRICX|nr:hypothetical protein TNCV_210861 [Trichonephila clavipes]